MSAKILKSEDEYQSALWRVEGLMDARPGTPAFDELELLTLLIENYEEKNFPIDLPDPIEAIKFRMDQEGLHTRDMVHYLGSQSKVSEVLNRKRPLSLAMIRTLSQGLGIPAEVLLQPVELAVKVETVMESEEFLPKKIFSNCENFQEEKMNSTFLDWCSLVTSIENQPPLPPFRREKLDESFWREIVRLSRFSQGPRMVTELLNHKGISLVVIRLKSRLNLDGACFYTPSKNPLIGLTLRRNRLEDFWLVLLHLLTHLYLYKEDEAVAFFDSLDCIFHKGAPSQERAVVHFMKKNLIPQKDWEIAYAKYLKSQDPSALKQAAEILEVAPEIISCRLRLEEEQTLYAQIFPSRKVSEKLEVYG
jgi:HTH-type transcriptional regulator / antitoxin HigA